ncbi:hypothetical protein FRACYDRAFT_213134 [Fragilariopsis cylindrus CCMP1102]|uniref:Helicase-associated domain-containing protein n=1 Tax=Fragilariopsis cylindrus CCMP1102 TaxID=635003 RepID=A0A1E7EN72_9STRA|nr:hypothetical protein FRACYDRAFT_213134 [Fragilariopsis cylindrus CCMP1102]|eukprot:OEU07294.1 hypothetical protein FRACYDRAFT_213134 [Fragilariopsis cylindrus CCMP1102]
MRRHLSNDPFTNPVGGIDDNDDTDDGDKKYNKDSDDDDDGNNAVSSTKSKKGKDTVGRCTLFDDKRWEQKFQRLIAYKKRHKSTNVPSKYKKDPKLGSWVHNQRKLYKNNELSEERINHLESIGFAWDLHNTQWMEMYQRLVAYKKQHKSTNVPKMYKTDPKFGSWVLSQRQFYKNNELSEKRLQLLNAINFVWSAKNAWVEMYQRLVAYKKQHKSTNVPSKYKQDPKLGTWVYSQRQFYKNNELSEERINHLGSLGFVWNQHDAKWTEMYIKLVEYKRQHHGSTLVPIGYTEDPSFGRWVSKQSYAYNEGNMLEKRLKLLNSIGFVWNSLDVQWTAMYNKLVEYKRQHHGSTTVPQRYMEDPQLGQWVRAQRKNNKLTDKRMELLNSINFVWSVKKASIS